MKKIILQVSAVLLLAVSISAQDNQPELFDEFGNMPLDETMARLDALALQIQNAPNSKALIRISGGRENYFASAYMRGSILRAMWDNIRKYSSPEKLSIQFCNVNKEPLWHRFFIVRENDKVEGCDENLTVPKQTLFFDTVSFYFPTFKLKSLESSLGDIYGASEGEYSKFAQDILKRMLKDSPGSKVYLIAYLKTNFETDENGKVISRKTNKLDKKYLAARMLQAARKELIKNGFSISQIVALDGGYKNASERHLEFWFVPKDGAIPKPKPDYVPKRTKN